MQNDNNDTNTYLNQEGNQHANYSGSSISPEDQGFIDKLDSLTPEQLKAVEAAAKKTRETKAQAAITESYDMFVDAAEEAGLTIEKALSICNPALANKLKSSTKKTPVIKYRNPNNKEESWSGRGRKPAWFVNNLAEGMDEQDMRV